MDACVEQLVKFSPRKNETNQLDAMDNYVFGGEQSNRNSNRNETSYASTATMNARNFPQRNTSNGSNYNNNRQKTPTCAEHPQMQQIVDEINKNYRVMILMRGAPGSGKSHLAKTVLDRTMDGDYGNHIFSTDDFFYDNRAKQYNFDRQKLPEAHEKNQFRVTQRALNGWSPIIVDNTNVKLWEMFPYVKEGIKNGYLIRILEPNTPWSQSVGQLSKRNKHQVNGDAISRMLINFEKATVDELLRSMKLKAVTKPQLRVFPQIKQNVNQAASFSQCNGFSSVNNAVEEENTNEDWVRFEAEQQNFWNNKPGNIPNKLAESVPKVERSYSQSNTNTGTNNIFELLREAKVEADQKDGETKTNPLVRHQKNCPNENSAFQGIRNIYPNVPISLLWDLFEKCNGDGDWTMDILLNENFIDGVKKLSSNEEIERDNFTCSCRSSTVSTDLMDAAKAIPPELLSDYDKPSTSNYQPRKVTKAVQKSDSENVRRLIEEQFVISDDHYSNHTRKIRDMRRNQSILNAEIKIDGLDVIPDDPPDPDIDGNQETEEMVEVDLGINLICQLDSAFGTSAIQADNLKNISTTVFLPRSLGQQLYATWVESLFNQIEEQRMKMIKDDEILAKELQQKEAPKSKPLFENPQRNNLNEFVDMAYAWSAYKADNNEWRQSTPENLAMKLTKAKLFELFPGMDRDTLIDVFHSNGNNFEKTVEMLKTMLPNDVDEKIRNAGESLLNQVKEEVQTVN